MSHSDVTGNAAWSSKMLASYHITMWHHNPEDCKPNLYHCENLKSRIIN